MQSLPRLCVFDFGSNSLKLSIFRYNQSKLVLESEAREFTAVGDDVFKQGAISEEKARETEEAIERLKHQIDSNDAVMAAATSAFREAENGGAMLERFGACLGAKILLLDGEDEARLIALGVRAEQHAIDAAVLDIGGGSVELIRNETVASYDLGAIRLREMFDPSPDDKPPSRDGLARMNQFIIESVGAIQPLDGDIELLGSGGGFTTLGDIIYGCKNRSGVTVELEMLRRTADAIQRSSANDLAQRHSLPLRRARIMAAGSLVALRMIEQLGKEKITISWAGLREGLAWRLIHDQIDKSRADDNSQ